MRFSLRQHGSLSLMCVVFRPAGRKTTHKALKSSGWRKSYFLCCVFAHWANTQHNSKESTAANVTMERITMSQERFLVTGALGCIGAWVVRNLVREGAEPVVFDLASDPRRLKLIMTEDELAKVTFV